MEIAPQQKIQDINDRCDKAMVEIRPILEKYQLEFAARIHGTEAAIIALPVLKDTKYPSPVKSPIQMA
jgi:hypothetical protein